MFCDIRYDKTIIVEQGQYLSLSDSNRSISSSPLHVFNLLVSYYHLFSVEKLQIFQHLVSIKILHVFNHLVSVAKLRVIGHLVSIVPFLLRLQRRTCCWTPCLLSVESREVNIIGNTWGSRGNFLGVSSRAVDITMRPYGYRLTQRIDKYHETCKTTCIQSLGHLLSLIFCGKAIDIPTLGVHQNTTCI
jgi:hypothetical protein